MDEDMDTIYGGVIPAPHNSESSHHTRVFPDQTAWPFDPSILSAKSITESLPPRLIAKAEVGSALTLGLMLKVYPEFKRLSRATRRRTGTLTVHAEWYYVTLHRIAERRGRDIALVYLKESSTVTYRTGPHRVDNIYRVPINMAVLDDWVLTRQEEYYRLWVVLSDFDVVNTESPCLIELDFGQLPSGYTAPIHRAQRSQDAPTHCIMDVAGINSTSCALGALVLTPGVRWKVSVRNLALTANFLSKHSVPESMGIVPSFLSPMSLINNLMRGVNLTGLFLDGCRVHGDTPIDLTGINTAWRPVIFAELDDREGTDGYPYSIENLVAADPRLRYYMQKHSSVDPVPDHFNWRLELIAAAQAACRLVVSFKNTLTEHLIPSLSDTGRCLLYELEFDKCTRQNQAMGPLALEQNHLYDRIQIATHWYASATVPPSDPFITSFQRGYPEIGALPALARLGLKDTVIIADEEMNFAINLTEALRPMVEAWVRSARRVWGGNTVSQSSTGVDDIKQAVSTIRGAHTTLRWITSLFRQHIVNLLDMEEIHDPSNGTIPIVYPTLVEIAYSPATNQRDGDNDADMLTLPDVQLYHVSVPIHPSENYPMTRLDHLMFATLEGLTHEYNRIKSDYNSKFDTLVSTLPIHTHTPSRLANTPEMLILHNKYDSTCVLLKNVVQNGGGPISDWRLSAYTVDPTKLSSALSFVAIMSEMGRLLRPVSAKSAVY